MKKQVSLFFLAAAIFGVAPAVAATNSGTYGASSADLTGAPATRARTSVNYEKYETRSSSKTYTTKDSDKNLYYSQPSSRSSAYNNMGTTRTESSRTTRSESSRTSAKRKYYLAHPFFQPLEGKVGSVTDLSYASSSYNVALTPLAGFTISDDDAKWDMKRFSVKEDLSYGITDRLAVVGMLQYDSSTYTMDWSTAPDDTMKDSGINLYGLGLQWRFTDSAEWIATLSGYFQHQTDIANTFIADLKAGYKVNTSTFYGLLRGWLVDFEGNSYGNGIDDGNGTAIFIAYDTDVSTAFYVEGGLGVFTVLGEDWTLNLEAVFGNYDWHNQASLKGAIGWQPGESFALNLYAKTAIYDSADGQDLGFWWLDPSLPDWEHRGTAHISNYAEWTIGAQAILYF